MKAVYFAALLIIAVSCNFNTPKRADAVDTADIPIPDSTVTIQTDDPETAIENTGIAITDGYFRMSYDSKQEEIKKQYELELAFVALMINEQGASIKPAGIEVKFSENECTGYPEATLYANGNQDFLVLISGLKQYNKIIGKSPVLPGTELMPDKPIVFLYNNESYSLYATADVEDEVYNAQNYRIYFNKGAIDQPLAYIDMLEYAMPSILFIGDIDNDGFPDLLLQEGHNYEYHKIALYLSSYADKGELVKNVAVDEEWRDC